MVEEGGVAKGKNKKKKVQKVEGEGEKAKAEEVIEKKKEKEEWVNGNERLVGDFFVIVAMLMMMWRVFML